MVHRWRCPRLKRETGKKEGEEGKRAWQKGRGQEGKKAREQEGKREREQEGKREREQEDKRARGQERGDVKM